VAALSVAADCGPGKPVWNPQAVSRLTFGLGGYEARGRSLERNQRFARHGSTAARGEHAHLPPTGSSGLSRRWHPHPSCTLHGPVSLDGEAGRGSRRRGERELRPGCLDAAEARGRVPGRPGARRPRAIGGDGHQPGLIQRPGPRNVGAAARRDQTLPAITLSDTGVRGERAHSRRSARQRLLDVRASDSVRIGTFRSLAGRSARQLLPGAAPVAACKRADMPRR
jgi:hypothetical protein